MNGEIPDYCPKCGVLLCMLEQSPKGGFVTELYECQGVGCGRRYATHSEISYYVEYDSLKMKSGSRTRSEEQILETVG